MILKGIFRNSGVASRLLILVGFSFVFGTLASLFFISDLQADRNNVELLKILQLAESISIFILPALLTTYLFSHHPSSYLKVDKAGRVIDFLLVGLLMVVLIPFINYVSEWNQQLHLPTSLAPLEKSMRSLEENVSSVTERFLDVHSVGALSFNLLLIAVIPALGEELYFRAVIQTAIREKNKVVFAVLITAFVFSAIHMQFYGFVPRFLMGMLLGFIFVWSDNLWLPVFAQFVNNGVAVVFYYLKFNDYKVIDMEKIGTNDTAWLVLPSALLATVSIIYIYKRLIPTKS
jgi:membrane protease YdiL (CAAX protease family)